MFFTAKQHGTTWQPPALDRERPGYEIRLQLAKTLTSVYLRSGVFLGAFFRLWLRYSRAKAAQVLRSKQKTTKKPPATQDNTDACVGLREEIASDES